MALPLAWGAHGHPHAKRAIQCKHFDAHIHRASCQARYVVNDPIDSAPYDYPWPGERFGGHRRGILWLIFIRVFASMIDRFAFPRRADSVVSMLQMFLRAPKCICRDPQCMPIEKLRK
jgi:hypothetical protein